MTMVTDQRVETEESATLVPTSLLAVFESTPGITIISNEDLSEAVRYLCKGRQFGKARAKAHDERVADPLASICYDLYAYGLGPWRDVLVVQVMDINVALFGTEASPMRLNMVENLMTQVFGEKCTMHKTLPQTTVVTGGKVKSKSFRIVLVMTLTALGLSADSIDDIIKSLQACSGDGWLVLTAEEED